MVDQNRLLRAARVCASGKGGIYTQGHSLSRCTHIQMHAKCLSMVRQRGRPVLGAAAPGGGLGHKDTSCKHRKVLLALNRAWTG